MSERIVNAANSYITATMDNSQTTMVVANASSFPGSATFRCLIKAEGANTNEIVTVTSVAGNTFTITRASEAYAGSSAASAHTSNAAVWHVITDGGLRQFITDTSGASVSTWPTTVFQAARYL